MTASRRAADPWQPIYGDEIGPTRGQRARNAITLFLFLVVLGIAFAASIGLAVLSILALVGVSFG